MLDEQWQKYAKTWSQETDRRNAALGDITSEDMTYTDPNSEVVGRDAFSAHIAQFQGDVPDAYFEIIEVKDHHNKTLARWRLCGQDGNEMMLGTSFATLAENGKFTSFTGFF
jgi:hypothetical protein